MPGSPYTGSTLLGFLLNEHPACVSIGAGTGLTRQVDLATYHCSCGRPFRGCDFWNEIAQRTRDLGHPVNVFETNFWNTHLRVSDNRFANALLVRSLGWGHFNRLRDALVRPLVGRAISQAGWKSWSLATAVLAQTHKSVFVDTARDHQRPKYLAQHPLLDVRVIHLVRDSRGNSASIMKHTGVDVVTAARQWRHYNVEAARVRNYLPPESWLSVHYEDLCTEPQAVLNQIFEFVGVEPIEGIRVGSNVHHIIGNSMRLRGLNEITVDRSWETALSREDVAQIARIAGPTSRDLGFDWP
jgi:hypothetical protein